MFSKLTFSRQDASRILEPLLPLLTQSLFPLAVYYQSSDSTNPQMFKTSHEILRAFEIIGTPT